MIESSTTPSTTPLRPTFPISNLLIRKLKKLPVFTLEQLAFIGRDNLSYLLREWQQALMTAQPYLNQLQERVDLLEGKTVADLQQLAISYDCPDYPTKTDFYYPRDYLLNTDDPESLKRAAGSTTFNICGWCQHALCEGYPICHYTTGGHRVYRPSCGFFDSEWKSKFTHDFNHPCTLTHCTDAELSDINLNLRAKYLRYRGYCESIQAHIAFLQDLIPKTEAKPPFPACRAANHYQEDTPAYLFRYDSNLNRSAYSLPYPLNHYFSRFSCTTTRGIITTSLESTYFHPTDAAPDAQPIRVSYDDARLLPIEDLTYLLDHPDYAQIWLTSIENPEPILREIFNFHQQYHYLPSIFI